MMLDVLCRNVICNTIDAHIANYFNVDANADKLSKRLLNSSSFIAPITTFVRLQADTTLEIEVQYFIIIKKAHEYGRVVYLWKWSPA